MFSTCRYFRARYYNPALGTFMSLDPFEGAADRAMSLNGYSWVEGNVVNAVDPSGMQPDQCTSGGPQGFANCGSDGTTTGYGGRSVYTPTINWQRIADVMRRLRQLERICFWLNGNLCFELGRLLTQDQASGNSDVNDLTMTKEEENRQTQINMDTVSAQTLTTADPAAIVAKAIITGYILTKQVVMTQTALLEFYAQLGAVAGQSERLTANTFLLAVKPIQDDPSIRIMNLRETRQIGRNDKIIFGTADRLGIMTITADESFLRAALEQGVNLYAQVLRHLPFSFIGE